MKRKLILFSVKDLCRIKSCLMTGFLLRDSHKIVSWSMVDLDLLLPTKFSVIVKHRWVEISQK